MSKVIVNKVAIARFLRERGIPTREAIFASVILGNAGIDLPEIADAFDVAVESPPRFQAVYDALEAAHVQSQSPTVLADELALNR
ncbi:hypothetical protein PBI_SEBATA_39 [Mycobacterium phage Sebata]|uniref:Uncharacterized protein n=2 Tax=Bixzunavirus TaxID=680114 RepID=G1JXD6_9CAUD|nr:hypothetical protein LINSTU_39 [Mycobacterium phage LinStu]YP_009608724.1 hypothetical protein FDI20_gp039 [Mycobacterium phage Sebata]AEK06516.1 hypothetical protein PBI_SEBATA_39 [Mycobacterium phage Sebata]AEL98282.1 hypothetical protein LINSTU_39 [Mycobacterium phage LinStu]WMI34191.1 hypothetical protein SEA_CARAVAN_36 [Mycobacterium phage Caravan]